MRFAFGASSTRRLVRDRAQARQDGSVCLRSSRIFGQTGRVNSTDKDQPMFKGFRDFVLRGNVVDLAVAVVIGAAFTAIVNALVTDIINPLIAAIVHKPDFSFLTLNVHGGVIKYGDFLNALISFLIIAATIYFLVVLPVNTLLNRFRPKVV